MTEIPERALFARGDNQEASAGKGRKQAETQTDRFGRVLAVVIVLCLAAALMLASIPEKAAWLAKEGQFFETLSAIMLVLSAIVVLLLRPVWRWLHVSLICLLLAEREFEPSLLPEGNIFRDMGIWLDESVLDNLIVRLLLAAWIIPQLLIVSLPLLRRAWLLRSPVLKLLVAACGAAAVGQVIDRLIGRLHGSSLEIYSTNLDIVEEVMEFYFAGGVLAACVLGWWMQAGRAAATDAQQHQGM